MDFVAAPRLGDGETVVLGEGRLAFVPQVHSQLVLSGCCDLVQVGQACGRQRRRDRRENADNPPELARANKLRGYYS